MSATPSSTIASSGAISGRAAAMARRQAISAGKAALPPPKERIGHGERGSPPMAAPATAMTPEFAANAGVASAQSSCREQARARRAMRCTCGRGDSPPAVPSRPPRQDRLQHAPHVVASATQARQSVTGLSPGRGSQVTGADAGAGLPVSGTQSIGSGEGTAVRSGAPKVGHARTARGGIVSGTLVRSQVRITGDEAGAAITITGEADQSPEDDLTPRGGESAAVASPFQRQAAAHGHRTFGTHLSRGATHAGSRERRREARIESTDRGLAITGSTAGRTTRVTGDEDGACRQITGNQYLSPARAQAESDAQGGGGAQPVTRQRVTGCDVDHNPRVTGTPYQGTGTTAAWGDPASGDATAERLPRRAAELPVTGDAPMHAERVTGTARGAARAITGTPYFRPAVAVEVPTDPVAAIEQRFSLRSPQRTAHLKANGSGADERVAAGRITGSFALSEKKVTGNLEFLFKPRREAGAEPKPAHARLTGEGRSVGQRISGHSWADHSRVTGTESATAADRNPSERGGKPQAFAGAVRFKSLAHHEEHKQLVTGMAGWSSKSAARVTLSGGAQG